MVEGPNFAFGRDRGGDSALLAGWCAEAGLAFIDGSGPPQPTAAHIGPNATFGEQVRKVEAHLIDYDGDLYGRTITLDTLRRLRPTRRFEGLDDLLRQIRLDVEQARMVCRKLD